MYPQPFRDRPNGRFEAIADTRRCRNECKAQQKEPDLSGQWTTLTPDSATTGKVDEPMAFSKSDLEAFEQCGVEPKIKKSVSGCET